jgi:hypothetical protein
MSRPRSIYIGNMKPGMTGSWPRIVADNQKVPSLGSLTSYWPATFASIQTALDFIWNQGAIPVLDWNSCSFGAPPSGFANTAITAGVQDTFLNTWFAACNAWNKPIFIVFDCEMNGSWMGYSDFVTTWGDPTYGPNAAGSFSTMFQHVVNLQRANGCTNISWVFAPNLQAPDNTTPASAQTRQPLAQFFPPGYWHVLSWDGFDTGGSPNMAQPSMTFDQLNRGYAGYLGNTLANLQALDPNMGILINSFGSDTRLGTDLNPSWATAPIVDGPHRGNWWLDTLLTQLPSSIYSRVIGLTVFDSDNNAATTPFPIPPGFSTADNDTCVGSPDPAATSGTYGGLAYTVRTPAAALDGWRKGVSSSLYLQGGKFQRPPLGTRPDAYWTMRDTDLLRTSILSLANLQGFWEFNDASGATVLVDSSGNARNGTVPTGATIALAQPKVAPQGSTSISFPGDVTNGYAAVADNAAFSVVTANGLTVGCVFQANVLPVSGSVAALVSKGTAGQYEWTLRITSTGVEFIVWSLVGGTYTTAGTGPIVAGKPYLVMATIDTTLPGSYATPSSPKGIIYLYGATATQSADFTGQTLAHGTAPINFGRRGDATSPFNGRIQYAFVTSSVQSAATFNELQRAFDPGSVLPYASNTFIQDILNTNGVIDLWVGDDPTGTVRIQNNLATERYLTPHGSVTLQQPSIIPSSPTLGSIALGGTVNDWLDATSVADWSVTQTGKLSITVGFYPTSIPAAGTFGTIISKAGNGSFEWAIRVIGGSQGRVEWIGWTPQGATIWSAQTAGPDYFVLNQWNFLTVTFNSAHAGSNATPSDPLAYITVNGGQSYGSGDFAAIPAASNAPITVGRRGDGSQPFAGRIAVPAVYNVELTRAVHDMLYNASTSGTPIVAADSEALVSSETASVSNIVAAPASSKGSIWYCHNINYMGAYPPNQNGYYGQTIDGTNDVISIWESRAAAAMGAQWVATAKRVPSLSWGQQWMMNGAYYPFSSVRVGLDNCLNAGRIPFLHWGPWQITPNHGPDYSLRPAAIAAGNHDNFLHQWFAACAAWGRPFFMRWIHEDNANNGWGVDNFPWCVGTMQSTSSPSSWVNTPSDIVGAKRKVRAIQLQEGATNCALATCFNIMGTGGSTSVYHLADLYPGSDNQVDLNTLDGYNQTDPTTGPSFYQVFRGVNASPAYSSLRDTWGELMALDPSGSIPLGIAEVNCNLNINDTAHRIARGNWYTNMFQDFADPVKFPRAAIISPFYWGNNYDATNANFAPEFDGTQTSNPDYLAYIQALGRTKYVSYPHFTPLPNNRTPTSYAASTQQTPFENALLSTEVIVGAWNFDDAVGATTLADASGLNRTLANSGMLLQQAPVVPSETRRSAGFTGTSYADGGDLDDYSFVTTGQLCIVTTVVFQTVPTGPATIVAKANLNNNEWELRANGNAIEFLAWEPLGATYASALAAANIIAGVPMLIVAQIDVNATPHMRLWAQDPTVTIAHGSADFAAAPGNTTSTLRFGQRGYGDHQAPSGMRIGICALLRNTITDQSYQELWNSFSSGNVKIGSDASVIVSVETRALLPTMGASDLTALAGKSTETAATPGVFTLTDTDLLVSGESTSMVQSRLIVSTDIGTMFETEAATLLQVAAPIITGVVASRLSDTSVLITWNTDKPSTSQVEYGLTTVYGTLTPINPTAVTAHSVVISNLLPNTTYHFRVRSDG